MLTNLPSVRGLEAVAVPDQEERGRKLMDCFDYVKEVATLKVMVLDGSNE
jgi:hypothetical protein